MKKLFLSLFLAMFSFALVWCTNNDSQNVDESRLDYLVLVNKQHKLPDDWEWKLNLVEVQNFYAEY